METKELKFNGLRINGFLALFLFLLIPIILIVCSFIKGGLFFNITGGVLILLTIILNCGYMQLEPNEARVMVFFGQYKGTFRETGFFWVNPFMETKKLSLRARNLDVEPIKVNDKTGNPILIGLVLVWKLKDTYKAMFEIDAQTMAESAMPGKNGKDINIGNTVANRMNAFENFVKIQSDAALRQVAGQYAYDDNEAETNELTLRSGGEEINEQLEQKLNERLDMAGIEHQLSGLCSRNCSRHVASPTGSCHHQRTGKNRRGSCINGTHGTRQTVRRPNRRTGRRKESCHGQQSARGTVCR